MAKKIKTPKSENSIIGSWVQSNEQKLDEIQTLNPELFSAVGAVLNYLNTYLGGTSEIKIEPKTVVLKTAPIEESTFPYPYPLYQWRIQSLSWFEDKYDTINWKKWAYDFIKQLAGKRLFTFLDDNEGLSKICDFTAPDRNDYFFKNIDYYISREEITLDPLPSTDVIRPEKLEWMDSLIQYCKDKIGDGFQYFYDNNSKDLNPVVRARRDNAISLANDEALNEAEERYLFDKSDVAWWGYQWANVGFRTDEFWESTFINENGYTYKVLEVHSKSDATYSVQFIDLDSAGVPLDYEITRVEMAKALLGVSFKAINSQTLNNIKETFQALSLPNKKRLPILIGDIVELISTKGKSAQVGSKALVSEVSLWSTVWVDEMPKNVNTMIDVVWLNEEMANGQNDGGYPIQDFKNFSRPEFESLKITNKVALITANKEHSIDPLKTNIKIKVQNESESKAFQEWAFSKGAKWATDGQTLSFLDELFFIIEDGGQLMYYGKKAPDAEDLFNGDDAKLVTLEELGIEVPPPTTMSESIDPLTDEIKIEVQNESEAKAFQDWAFSKGVVWAGINKQNVSNLDKKYFYISKGVMTFGSREDVFEKGSNEQVTLEELGISVPSVPTREALKTPQSQPSWVQSVEEINSKLTKENLWGKSVEETNPKLKIDFAEALKIIDKNRRTESDKAKLTLFFCNVYYVEKGTKEYDVLAKEYEITGYEYAPRSLPNKIYFVEPKPKVSQYGLEIETILQGSELQLESWIVSLPWADIQSNMSTDKDKTAMKKAIIDVAKSELGQEEVDRILSSSVTPPTPKKTTIQTPTPKPDVQDLYGELDDLDI